MPGFYLIPLILLALITVACEKYSSPIKFVIHSVIQNFISVQHHVLTVIQFYSENTVSILSFNMNHHFQWFYTGSKSISAPYYTPNFNNMLSLIGGYSRKQAATHIINYAKRNIVISLPGLITGGLQKKKTSCIQKVTCTNHC